MAATGRRSFFRFSLNELTTLVDDSRGFHDFRLSDLPGLSDDRMGSLVPLIVDPARVSRAGALYVCAMARGEPAVLFPAGSRASEVWTRIDGQSSVRQIADALAGLWNEPPERTFSLTRGVFQMLAAREICVPRNALEP